MEINGIIFDENKLKGVQDEMKGFLDIIDSQKNGNLDKKGQIFSLVEKRVYKYAVRIRDEYKLKTGDEIKERFYTIVNDIVDFCNELIEKQGEITQQEINILHEKLFPKGLWGSTKGTNGRAIAVLYKAGIYRKHREFTKYNGEEYDYLNFNEIEKSIAEIFDFYQKIDLHILTKTFYLIAIILYIHPYYNGNGTVFRILLGILLLKNGYNIPSGIIEFLEFDNEQIFNFRHKGDYKPLLKGFLELFLGGKT